MLTTAAISTVLALAPPTELAPPDFGSQLDTVEFIDSGEDVQLVAYDVGGEVIGMIALALPTCPFAMGAAACHCLPLAIKEFEGHSCYHKPKPK